jgi:hypothetical protein
LKQEFNDENKIRDIVKEEVKALASQIFKEAIQQKI